MEIQISIDQEEFKEKPGKKQAGIISSRIGGEGQYMELSKIAAAVGGRGRKMSILEDMTIIL